MLQPGFQGTLPPQISQKRLRQLKLNGWRGSFQNERAFETNQVLISLRSRLTTASLLGGCEILANSAATECERVAESGLIPDC